MWVNNSKAGLHKVLFLILIFKMFYLGCGGIYYRLSKSLCVSLHVRESGHLHQSQPESYLGKLFTQTLEGRDHFATFHSVFTIILNTMASFYLLCLL